MTFFGRIIGVFLGWLILGPLGALIGFVIGSFFDRGLKLHLHQIPREHTAEVQQSFFKATFSVMGYLAKADGRVSQQEIRAAENIMSRLELNESMRVEAIRLFNEGKQSQFDVDQVLRDLYRECHRHRDLLRFFIEIQLEAALADGELKDEEQQVLLHICERLNFSPRDFQELWARQWASQAFHHWYQQYQHYQHYGQYDETHRDERSQRQYRSQGGSRAYSRRPPSSQETLADAYE
jgi:DnaJ like chaperone protein